MSLSAVGLLLALSWFSVVLFRAEATGSCPNSPMPCLPCVHPLPGRPGPQGPPGPAGAVSEAKVLQLRRELVAEIICELRTGDTSLRPATSCKEIHECNSTAPSGKYWLNTRTGPVEVYCDMETDGGGWTVLMKRQDGSVDFYLNWTDYKNGFGNLEGEHWLGLDNMHLLTHKSSDPPELRVDLADWEGNTAFAKYDQFSVGDEDSDYTLSVSGYQSASTAGDSLTITRSTEDGPHNGQKFSTPDRENDIWPGNCAVSRHGPWWHRQCYDSLLTGKYYTSPSRPFPPHGIIWHTWRGHTYSLHYADMKIRPRV